MNETDVVQLFPKKEKESQKHLEIYIASKVYASYQWDQFSNKELYNIYINNSTVLESLL